MKHPGVKYLAAAQRRKIKKKLLREQLNKCAICQRYFYISDRMTFDHIVPLAKGGTNHDNLQIVHFHCNQEKADVYDQKKA